MTVMTTTGTVTVNPAFLLEIKEVNQDLWRLLTELRHRCQRPLAPAHCRHLIDKLCQLRDQLALHFSLEEAYGYFEDPVEVAPQLCRQAEQLRGEHKELYLDFSDLIERAERMFYDEQHAALREKLGVPPNQDIHEFLVGLLKGADTVRKIASLGHTVATHTWTHQNLAKIGSEAAREEIELGISAVQRSLGTPAAPFFRFPYLSDPKAMIGHLKDRNTAIFSIDVDSYDFKTRSQIGRAHV